MAADANPRRWNPAVLSVFHHAYLLKSRNVPFRLPRQMQPMSLDRAVRHLRDGDGEGKPDPHLGLARQAAHSALKNLEGSQLQHAMKDLLSAKDLQAPFVTDAQPRFDPDTWITTVEAKSSFKVGSRDEAIAFVNLAYPTNWEKAVPQIFKASKACTKQNNDWVALDSPPGNKDFFLYEHVQWDWNEQNDFEVCNIFSVSDLAGASDSSDPVLLKYNYTLHQSLWSKALIVRDYGGLDVDGGTYEATYEAKTRMLKISATKSVRYTAPSNGPYDISLALNMMAPATTTMLMHRLVGGLGTPPT